MKVIDFLSGIFLILIYIALGAVFNGNHIMMLPLTLSFALLTTIFYLNKKKASNIIFSVIPIIPIFFLFIVTGLVTGVFSRSILYLIFIPISSSLAYYIYSTRKLIIIPFFIFLFFLIGIYCYNSTFILIENFNAEKNSVYSEFSLVDKLNRKVNFSNDKIIVLDFWSTTCGICFEKFPDFEKVTNFYKNNKNVEFYAVNVPIDKKDKFENTVKILDSIGYKFPKLYAQSAKEIENKLHFNTFPHLIIIKNGKIRYDGMLETKENTYLFSIESEIEKLLNE